MEWLIEQMGFDYAKSYEGKVFLALENAWLKGKSKAAFQGLRQILGKKLVDNKPSSISQNLKAEISAQMIYAKAFDLNKCWQENPEQFAKSISNAFKIFKGKYS